ncbi:MAG: hypothetical protein ABR498_00700, partial [Candidatus Dormibacteria bacterium]
LPGLARSVGGVMFGALSAIRRDRIFHPDGAAFAATFEPIAGAQRQLRWSLLRHRRPLAAIVRLSRGAGLPQPLIDHLGISVRILDAYGAGRDQDLLFGASSRLPLARHLLLPARDFSHAWYSSVLPYRVHDRTVVLAAQPRNDAAADDDPSALARRHTRRSAEWTILAASPLGDWQPLATVRLEDALPAEVSQFLRFNPWNTGGGLRPAGPFNVLREGAYRGSQFARSMVAGSS